MQILKPSADELKRRGIDPKTMQPITKTAATKTPKKSPAPRKVKKNG
jgi:hypothetical protein